MISRRRFADHGLDQTDVGLRCRRFWRRGTRADEQPAAGADGALLRESEIGGCPCRHPTAPPAVCRSTPRRSAAAWVAVDREWGADRGGVGLRAAGVCGRSKASWSAPARLKTPTKASLSRCLVLKLWSELRSPFGFPRHRVCGRAMFDSRPCSERKKSLFIHETQPEFGVDAGTALRRHRGDQRRAARRR